MQYLIVRNIKRKKKEDPDFYNMGAIPPLPSSWTSEDNKSGTLISRMAQKTRPPMKTNNENIVFTSQGIHYTKFKADLYQGGRFPHILYHILMDAESMKYSDIVSFLPHGRAFVICNRAKFEEMVIPKFFCHRSYQSFQR